MKKFILLLILQIPLVVMAGIVILKNGDNITNVTNIEVGNNEIVYTLNNKEVRLPIENVSAILYDDGRYVTISPHPTQSANANSTVVDNNVKQNLDANYNIKQQYQGEMLDNIEQLTKELDNDLKQFEKLYPDEAKEVKKAKKKLNMGFLSKTLTLNINKIKNTAEEETVLKFKANYAYFEAKLNGMSWVEAVRAHNSVILNAISGNSNNGTTTSQNNYPSTNATASQDNW